MIPWARPAKRPGFVDDVERRHALHALQLEIGDKSFFSAFDDVVGEALIERQIDRFRFRDAGAAAEKFGDGRDVVLVDVRLRRPFHSGGRRVEEQILGEAAVPPPGRDAKRSSFSAFTMARSSPAFVQ